ncbi:MAG: AAA family ATPase, partial [Carnobacterium sp.]
MAKKIATKFVCQACGYESPKWMGRCPNCGAWNQMEEEIIADKNNRRSRVSMAGKTAKAQAIEDITVSKIPRVKTKLAELNRVLGGGVVPGSMVLIGGDPGIGKSTLLLQVSAQLNQAGGKVLYVSGEESAGQLKMSA